MPRKPGKKSIPPQPPAAAHLSQLTITLQDIEPPMWRTILVSPYPRLSELHRIFQGRHGLARRAPPPVRGSEGEIILRRRFGFLGGGLACAWMREQTDAGPRRRRV